MNEKRLKFGDVTRDPAVRELDDMRSLLLDRDYAQDAGNRPLYYMYRDLFKNEHRDTIEEHDLRFDITVMLPTPLGREYPKTKGHYHPVAKKGVAYPELYEVLEGKAHYLLQKKERGQVTDVVLVEATAGDQVIIPPGYGHITINPTDDKLQMANWVSTQFESQYQDIVDKGGGAYYEKISGDFIQNHAYDELPDIRFAEPATVPDLDINTGNGRSTKTMYHMIDSPHRLAFLNRPHKFQWVFESLYE